jgi:hypothetical protein
MNNKIVKSSKICAAMAFAFASFASPMSSAAVINSLFTQTSTQGTHNDFPGNRAVISDAFGEDHRGIAEFNIGSLGAFSSATLKFNVFSDSGGSRQISLVSYDADGVYSQSGDYSAASTGLISSFNASSFAAGDTLSFDITASLFSALANSESFIGFRLAKQTTGSIVDFRDFSIVTSSAVPEPSTMALLGLGLFGFLASRRKSKKV